LPFHVESASPAQGRAGVSPKRKILLTRN
jgi:hypothetical protein